MFTGIGLIAFCFIFGSALIGLFLSSRLRYESRTEATQKAVQNLMTVIGILSALVLGLLIAGTKTNFDTRSKEVEQFAANLTLLDRELSHFDIKDARDLLRAFTARQLALTWPKDRARVPVVREAQTMQMLDDIQQRLRAWKPENEIAREGRTNAMQLANELQQTSCLLEVQQNSQTPRPFIIVVIFWVSVLFLSYAVFAPVNAIVIVAMLVSSISVSMAVNLILDMDHPFSGFIRVPSITMQQALDDMKP